MEKDQIKSFVAGLGIASLVAGASLAAPVEAAQSGWGGKTGAVSASKEKSAVMKNVTSAAKVDKKAKKTKKKMKDAVGKGAEMPKEMPGKSGWGGSSK